MLGKAPKIVKEKRKGISKSFKEIENLKSFV